MKRMAGFLAVVCVFALTIRGAFPDTIYLKGGGKFEGKLVKETPSAYLFDIKGLGLQRIAKSKVLRVDLTRNDLDAYASKAGKLAVADKAEADRHFQLGLWCRREGLASQAKAQFERAIAIDPDHAGA